LMLNEKIETTLGIIEDAAEHLDALGIKNLILICESLSEAIINTLQKYAQEGFYITPIGLPDHGELRHQKMEDLAQCIGGIYFKQGNTGLSTDPRECLGLVKSATIMKYETILELSEEKIFKAKVEKRTEYLKGKLAEIKDSDIPNKSFVLDNMQERISLINSAACSIVVGGRTPAEINEKYDRFDDSKRATISAFQNGLILTSSQVLHYISKKITKEDDTEFVKEILKVLSKPYQFVTERIEVSQTITPENAYNIVTDEYGHPMKVGAIDPYAVVKSCIDNGFSTAKMLTSISHFLPTRLMKRY
jgi:chaperonin GroEL (HSP60 family)